MCINKSLIKAHVEANHSKVKNIDLTKRIDISADGYREGFKDGKNLQIDKGLDGSTKEVLSLN